MLRAWKAPTPIKLQRSFLLPNPCCSRLRLRVPHFLCDFRDPLASRWSTGAIFPYDSIKGLPSGASEPGTIPHLNPRSKFLKRTQHNSEPALNGAATFGTVWPVLEMFRGFPYNVDLSRDLATRL